jgi:transposase
MTPEKKPIEWTERVQVIRSLERAKRQAKHLEKRLDKAEKALQALPPEPGRGRRQYRDETALEQAISHVLEQYDVVDLLDVTWKREEKSVTRYVGRGRGSSTRPQRTEIAVRYGITEVKRNAAAIQRRMHRLGWSVQVTCVPQERLSLTQAVIHYVGLFGAVSVNL